MMSPVQPNAKPLLSHAIALLTLASWVGLLLQWRTPAGDAILVFARVDVLVCSLFLSLPLALEWLRRGRSASPGISAAAMFCGWGSTAALMVWAASTLPRGEFSEWSLVAIRGAIGLCVASGSVGFANLVARLAGDRRDRDPSMSPDGDIERVLSAWPRRTIFAGLWILVPAVYAHAVAADLQKALTESLQNQRIALAARQADQLSQLVPTQTIDGTPLVTLLPQLQQRRTQLIDQLADAAEPTSLGEIAQQITTLVQLERHGEALRRIEPLTHGANFHPVALDYQGLCFQRMERPEESMAAYRRSLEFWMSQPDSDAKTAGLVSGYKGIGFAARRLQMRLLEEQAYQQLVEIAPTGEHHFLLAQCYREHQKTRLASEQFQAAMQRDPSMQSQIEAILATLSMDHFSCLSVPR
ncbi:Tetratricopeptide repeat protein [Rosistilla carotiformis]|uniref:Tetratricopeptide repeat protein n=1 Tax=Rosistilla carotiformis TaxID=2528017 RepID=A0A518K0S3_9BACT|nr:tetratricopeptide repeat protein [Rosistilla carotiformis]QDV71390.1 Tetratricopeptide repeat protein [Rosistilla carotiformis]